jgi:formylglycine-generating enzyme
MLATTFKKIILLVSILHIGQSCGESIYITARQPKDLTMDNSLIPNDMVLIKGESDMESFYISVTEEPNINYLIYLDWLWHTYGWAYPEIYENALPKKQDRSPLYDFKDTILNAYDPRTHPAFSYFPIVGLTYEQIQNYLMWKTDRLNETILIKKGVLNPDIGQREANCFVTEAYLEQQYQGNVRKNKKDTATQLERNVLISDGLLVAGFRLPTEAEWLKASAFNKKLDPKRYKNPFAAQAINHPFGQGHHTIFFGRMIQQDKFESQSKPAQLNYEIDGEIRRKGLPYAPKGNIISSGAPNRLTSIGDYDPHAYGVANMETGVKEMLFDAWEEQHDNTIKNTFKIFEKNKAIRGLLRDAMNQPVEKDSVGRMRGLILGKPARVMGKDRFNKPIYWSFNYQEGAIPLAAQTKRVVRAGTWKNHSKSLREPIGENEVSNEVGFRVVLPYLQTVHSQ